MNDVLWSMPEMGEELGRPRCHKPHKVAEKDIPGGKKATSESIANSEERQLGGLPPR